MRTLDERCDNRNNSSMLEPAKTVIEICGGVSTVAEMVNRHHTRVRRWGYPKSKGGTGGLVPSEMQETLLIEARKRGFDLQPDHFFIHLGNAQQRKQ